MFNIIENEPSDTYKYLIHHPFNQINVSVLEDTGVTMAPFSKVKNNLLMDLLRRIGWVSIFLKLTEDIKKYSFIVVSWFGLFTINVSQWSDFATQFKMRPKILKLYPLPWVISK